VVPKKVGITMIKNKENELVPTRVQSGWRVCIDVVVLYFNNNNTTRNSTSHCMTVSILRVSVHRDCIGCMYQA
jgi:hypothetical protein